MKNIFFLLIAICHWSCEPVDNTPYYNFTSLDYEYIPTNYEPMDKTITFRNEQNEAVRLKVLFYTLNKEFGGGIGLGGNSTDAYYYDDLWIEIKLLDQITDGQIDGYCNRIYIHISKRPDDKLQTELSLPLFSISDCGGRNFIFISPYNDLNVMTVNNVTYDKVITLRSGTFFGSDAFFAMYTDSSVNELYYDLNIGFIGFSDTTNNINFEIVSN